ncbi:hypothetical protein DUI87_33495 [Hirundo rustica rustica]|uniref:Uncharacterized protein n=1 Tax=Hirundo rustica rustica TaxID=333673 RepID=A0A3M0INY0_HIRRU|nr:hypothetical protein DUI87_33495 [Hirundo rustica rustica]
MENPNPASFSSQLGVKEFPVEKRWPGIFQQFLEFIRSGCKEEMEESFTGFHVQSSKELRRSQEYLFCQSEEILGIPEEIPRIPEGILEIPVEILEIPVEILENPVLPMRKSREFPRKSQESLRRSQEYLFCQRGMEGIPGIPEGILGIPVEILEIPVPPMRKSQEFLRKSQEFLFCQRGAEEISWRSEEWPEEPRGYLEKPLTPEKCGIFQALGCSLHPLGKLLRALSAAFQAAYSGVGANRHLLAMAQDEVKFYAGKIWEFYR